MSTRTVKLPGSSIQTPDLASSATWPASNASPTTTPFTSSTTSQVCRTGLQPVHPTVSTNAPPPGGTKTPKPATLPTTSTSRAARPLTSPTKALSKAASNGSHVSKPPMPEAISRIHQMPDRIAVPSLDAPASTVPRPEPSGRVSSSPPSAATPSPSPASITSSASGAHSPTTSWPYNSSRFLDRRRSVNAPLHAESHTSCT